MADAEKYSSDSGSAGSRHREEIFERPKGMKGLYSHTATQVSADAIVWGMGG